jgi:hypothetical protein
MSVRNLKTNGSKSLEKPYTRTEHGVLWYLAFSKMNTNDDHDLPLGRLRKKCPNKIWVRAHELLLKTLIGPAFQETSTERWTDS